jgi:uncharacterized LabA/DUF88 family protein
MIVYIDGFNLYHGMHDSLGRSTLWLDLVKLAQSFRPSQQVVGVKYFTAPVLGDPLAQGRQAHYQAALKALYPNLFTVTQGRYQRKQVTCFSCNAQRDHYEEKETDVNIAVTLLTDAALHNMDTAIIVSADSDLVPAVKAAAKIRTTLFVAAAFPPKRVSKQMRQLMPSSMNIDERRLKKSQLPQTFSVNGATYTRPAHWV